MVFNLNYQSWVERNFRSQYLKILRNHNTKLSLSQKNQACQDIEKLAVELVEENKEMIVDEAARTHIAMTTLVLASYRVLLSHIKENESVINLLEDIFTGVGQQWIKLYIRLMLKFSRDPFRKMIEVSQKRVINNYGKTFAFEYSGDDRSNFVITTKKCFYHDFFCCECYSGIDACFLQRR